MTESSQFHQDMLGWFDARGSPYEAPHAVVFSITMNHCFSLYLL